MVPSLRPAVEVHRFDHQRVTVPMAARVAEPGRRPVLAMGQSFGVDHLEHRALLEEERDVLVVLQDLHRVRRERPDPSERHAAAGVVAVLGRVVVVPLRLSPWGEGQGIRLTDVARAVGVLHRPRHVLDAGPRPDAAEVRLAVGQPRRRRVHVHFGARRLCGRRSAQHDEKTDRPD